MGIFTGFEKGSGGTYIRDDNGDMVKISDEPPKIPKTIWFPKSGAKYFDRALQQTFHSKEEKRRYLREHKLSEMETNEPDSKRFDRAASIVNDERRKQGLKPKTVNELRGDTIYNKPN